ncbi:hypothetical protein C5167_021015 [Papaver somniferum]|uniref:F-box domain-containing protein n=1 Tax=Papaver somniferum TaxID=3469 RepID=A0A4Y7IYL8_PAPSO|nr:hypothetical protein C5167_021015 [Papaver somniferum]
MLINQDSGGSRRKDIISELPEPLIHHILSFLPTQCVVSTSVLSKRWRYIWTSVPVIDLCEVEFPSIAKLLDTNEEHERVENLYSLQFERLMNFVGKKLSLHHETRDIKKFYLDNLDVQRFQVEEWLSDLFTRQSLEEFVFYAESLPEGLFPSRGTYASLTILELGTWDPVYLPDAINFPNLKICRLRNATLCMHSEDLTQQFFSKLPVLEELELTDCDWNISELLISAPALKCLFITGPSEAAFFRGPIPKFKINIFAQNLLSLRSLPQEKDPISTKFIKKLSNVKRLKISGGTFEELLFPDDLFTNWPMFHNLVYLEVASKISFSEDKTLLNYLRISPNLATIIIAQCLAIHCAFDFFVKFHTLLNSNEFRLLGFVGYLSSTDGGWTLNMVPQCMLLHLKAANFFEFYGCLEDLNVVQTFLKYARVLERMIIKFDSNLPTDEQNEVMKKLLKFPRGSTSCIIELL